jgi:coenzyme F420-reducing hydrogenase delta subunit
LKALRGQPDADARVGERLMRLKTWQQQRLARTYADLAAQPRYAQAVAFFLDDLYGAKDFSKRDAEMQRIYPTLVRLLPHSTVETIDLALELDALSEGLDQAMAASIGDEPMVTEANYVKAFRDVGHEADRRRQVALVREVGERLDHVVSKPLIATTLRMLRKPAHLAGLGDLQEFLEHGFDAFKRMGGAETFLDTICRREGEILKRIFAGVAHPFEVE